MEGISLPCATFQQVPYSIIEDCFEERNVVIDELSKLFQGLSDIEEKNFQFTNKASHLNVSEHEIVNSSIENAVGNLKIYFYHLTRQHATYRKTLEDEILAEVAQFKATRLQNHKDLKQLTHQAVKEVVTAAEQLDKAKLLLKKSSYEVKHAIDKSKLTLSAANEYQKLNESTKKEKDADGIFRMFGAFELSPAQERDKQLRKIAKLEKDMINHFDEITFKKQSLASKVAQRDKLAEQARTTYEQLEKSRLRLVQKVLKCFCILEKQAIQQRLSALAELEAAVDSMDDEVDLSLFIGQEKRPELVHHYSMALQFLDIEHLRRSKESSVRHRSDGSVTDEKDDSSAMIYDDDDLNIASEWDRNRVWRDAEIDEAYTRRASTSSPPGGGGASSEKDSNSQSSPPSNSTSSNINSQMNSGVSIAQDIPSSFPALLAPISTSLPVNGSTVARDALVSTSASRLGSKAGMTAQISTSSLKESTNGPLADEMRKLFAKSSDEEWGDGRGDSNSLSQILESLDTWRLLLIESPSRSAFLQELDYRRGHQGGLLGPRGFRTMAVAMQAFLDSCQRSGDVMAAMRLANMANTFHCQDAAGIRSYLQGEAAVRSHSIWRAPGYGFWREALLLGVQSQLSLTSVAGAVSQPWDDMSAEVLREAVIGVHNIVFGQLGTMAFTMHELGMPREEVEEIVLRLGGTDMMQLGEDQRLDLLTSIRLTYGVSQKPPKISEMTVTGAPPPPPAASAPAQSPQPSLSAVHLEPSGIEELQISSGVDNSADNSPASTGPVAQPSFATETHTGQGSPVVGTSSIIVYEREIGKETEAFMLGSVGYDLL